MTGCLGMMGFNLGDVFKQSDDENCIGYFESRNIVLAHEMLLSDLGCRWDMVGALPAGWEESRAAQKAADTISNILLQQFMNQEKAPTPFVINDPRLCRFMPLWKRLLSSLNINFSLIFSFGARLMWPNAFGRDMVSIC